MEKIKKFFKFPSLYKIKQNRLNRAIKNHELNKQYYELNEEVRLYKKNSKQGVFSKRTISFCLSFISVYSLLCLYVQYKTGVDVSGLLKIISAVFGGELLLLLFKRIFSSEDKNASTLANRFYNKTKERDTSITTEDNLNDDTLPVNMESSIESNIETMVNEVNNSIDGGLG